MFSKTFKNKEVEIRGQKVALGESKLIKVPIDRLPTGILIEIPVYVFNGKKEGPTLLLQGGLHGDEVNGVELVRRMLINKTYKIKRGCVIVVPLLNIFGFLNMSRDMHGKDINRSFPGTKSGSLASRTAYYLIKEIIKNVDFGIDYHTGGKQRNNYPQIRYTPKDNKAKALAEIFNAPFIFGSHLIPKSFRKACYTHNIPVLVYEAGEALRLEENAIEQGINGTLRILRHFNMIGKKVVVPEQKLSIEITKRKWIRARKAGIFNSTIKNGSFVKKGTILGSVTDAFGKTKLTVKAPITGYIIAKNNFPIINMGDALFHIGNSENKI